MYINRYIEQSVLRSLKHLKISLQNTLLL